VSELEVLKEIRDVLVSQRSGPAGEGRGQEPDRGHDE
jgi:large conductance mechanosensitive channel